MSDSVISENPCLACTVHQDCCTRLTGLMLTEDEFQRCFSHHGEKVEVGREGPFYIINASEPAKCPNWIDGGCVVYEERPFECRLFPHNSYVRHHTPGKISIAIHEVRTCPLVHDLKLPETEAIKSVEAFAGDVYGNATDFEVSRESVIDRVRREWTLFRLRIQRGVAKLSAKRS